MIKIIEANGWHYISGKEFARYFKLQHKDVSKEIRSIWKKITIKKDRDMLFTVIEDAKGYEDYGMTYSGARKLFNIFNDQIDNNKKESCMSQIRYAEIQYRKKNSRSKKVDSYSAQRCKNIKIVKNNGRKCISSIEVAKNLDYKHRKVSRTISSLTKDLSMPHRYFTIDKRTASNNYPVYLITFKGLNLLRSELKLNNAKKYNNLLRDYRESCRLLK